MIENEHCTLHFRKGIRVAAIVFLLGPAACADPNRVLFVTTTQIGIDADSKTQSANIGYSRFEGVVGPSYENGGVPPVYSRLKSNLAVIDPKISQLYATGDAARLATGREKKWKEKPLAGKREIMFFGTGTNLGLKATFSTEAPAFSLGYKRQEFSLVPIGVEAKTSKGATRATGSPNEKPEPKNNDGTEDIYASVIAAIHINVVNKTFESTGVGVDQFFATGDAADELASLGDVRAKFTTDARDALDVREITCVEKPDASSGKIKLWLGDGADVEKSKRKKNTLSTIVKSEFGEGITNWELINCEGFADKREFILKKYDMGS